MRHRHGTGWSFGPAAAKLEPGQGSPPSVEGAPADVGGQRRAEVPASRTGGR
jgi:hypothetical protein